MRTLAHFPIISLLFVICLGASPATRPTNAIEPSGCVTSECHSKIKAFKILHGPVASNTCDSCHESTDVTKHEFTVRRTKADLCNYCHEFSVTDMPVIHKPVAEGQCLGCHDPHGGESHAIIRESSTNELCGRCHESITKDKRVLHSPVAKGACDSCHPPHASKFPKLLDAVGSDLCLACHQEMERSLADAKVKHKALKEKLGCANCHDVHGSNHPLSLQKPVGELCYDCHKPLQEKIAGATVRHEPVTSGKSCINCHSPHASNFVKLTLDSPTVLCLKCHNKDTKRQDGTIVGAVKDIANPKLHMHGELKDGQCGGCHTTHGGSQPSLLLRTYSSTFYQKFSHDNFALCFGCHNSKLAEDPKTTVTGFRNGERNLHYIHANEGNRDKNCRACHLMHTGPNVRLVRETLPYGSWDMPMRFMKTETGGSCFPGCHKKTAYDREKPVPTTGPSTDAVTRPVETITRSVAEDEQRVQWSVQDDQGRPILIPDQQHVSILVFVPDSVSESKSLLKELRASIPTDANTQIVLILNRSFDDPAVAELKTIVPSDWSIVRDGSHDAAESLHVRGRPVALVLRPDGSLVARLSASASVLTMKLAPYVEFAAGRSGTPTTQPTTHPVVEDRSKRLARDLRAVNRMILEDHPQDALDMLKQFDSSDRSTPAVKCIEAEALIRLKRSAEALRVLDSIGKIKNATPEETLARGRAWISLNEWNRARGILETNLKQLAESPEGHDLLGDIYAHDQQWRQASEQYRLASEIRKRNR